MGSLEDSKDSVLGDFARSVGKFSLPYLVVGAGARVLLSLKRDLTPGRLTTDWDLALPCPDWRTFDALMEALVGGPAAPFAATGIVHRLRHRTTGVQIDLIPFGGIEASPGLLIWPSGEEFNVYGFSAALLSGEKLRLEHGVVLVTSLPYQALLKAQSYLQRREQGTTHDVVDLVWVLQNYGECYPERIFDEAYSTIQEHELDPPTWGAALLGLDLRTADARLLVHLRVVIVELQDELSRACNDALGGGFQINRESKLHGIRDLARAMSLGLDDTH